MSFQAHIDLVWCASKLVSAMFGLVVHKLDGQALPDLDAGARLPGREWRPKEASAGSACALPMAGTWSWLSPPLSSLIRFEGSCGEVKWAQVLVVADGHNKPDF